MNFQDQTIEAYQSWYHDAARDGTLTTLNAYLAGVQHGLRKANQILLEGTDERSRSGQ